ncbi:hypothetical protein J529_4160 [Acinetobacter baumannii 99063]|uniref:Transposase n=1 Tax=Acinetobacter baumannii 99063 TaxID=1310630 RepID=A0A009R6J0_ACIBA|nr:hypothetical protein J529_4678 [Acinetobacter baumannii 99063]EXC42787.1 hypothetical protein J529_4160 [Acinetobacter baumannii 99063]
MTKLKYTPEIRERAVQLLIESALLHKPICKGFFSDIIFK